MIVYAKEEMAGSKTGCYPDLKSLYSIIPREVRLHMERVGIYAEVFYGYLETQYPDLVASLGKTFGQYVRDLYILHDIGRAFVPIRFQNKAGGLTDEEFQMIKQHAMLAPTTLDSIYQFDFPMELLLPLNNIALYHHERWDGRGYPFGIGEMGIPLEARICSLADAYDGMSSWKPYRKSMSNEKIAAIMKEEAGKQFQEELAYAFTECIDQMPREQFGISWEAQAGRYFH